MAGPDAFGLAEALRRSTIRRFSPDCWPRNPWSWNPENFRKQPVYLPAPRGAPGTIIISTAGSVIYTWFRVMAGRCAIFYGIGQVGAADGFKWQDSFENFRAKADWPGTGTRR